MTSADDLLRQATSLAEQIRHYRAQRWQHGSRPAEDLAAMEQQLRDLWSAIRAARVTPPPDGPLPFPRGTFSKVR